MLRSLDSPRLSISYTPYGQTNLTPQNLMSTNNCAPTSSIREVGFRLYTPPLVDRTSLPLYAQA